MNWRIPSFLFFALFFFLLLSSKGEGGSIDKLSSISHQIHKDVPNLQSGELLSHVAVCGSVHKGLKGRIGRGGSGSPLSDRAFRNGSVQTFSQQYAPLIGSEYCSGTFYSLTEALSCFLQSLLYPKHSFW